MEKFTQASADAVKALVERKNLANRLKKEMKEMDKEKYKDAMKASDSIVKEIDGIVALFIGKEDKRQGITRNPEISVMQRVNTASYYVQTRKSGVTKTEENLIQFAEEEVKAALGKTNAFLNQKWKAYQQEIEALELSPFTETKTITLE